MNLRALSYSVFATSFISLGFMTPSMAQNSGTSIKTSQSSGISVSISKIITSQRSIVVQFIVTNNTKARVYLLDASGERSQVGLLGSGTRLDYQQISGIERCTGDVPSCLRDINLMKNLNNFSYIEPGEFTVFGISYGTNTPASESDTISFSVALIARFSIPGADPSEAGEPKTVRFNFPYIQLKQH